MRTAPLKSENRKKQNTAKTVTAKAEKKDWSAVKQSAILMINANIKYCDCLVLPTKVKLLLTYFILPPSNDSLTPPLLFSQEEALHHNTKLQDRPTHSGVVG